WTCFPPVDARLRSSCNGSGRRRRSLRHPHPCPTEASRVTFTAYADWWWPYLFILLGGWVATDFWRFLGVYLGERLSEQSQLLVLVRCIATGLVAAVIANLIVFPSGELASTPMALRIGA